MVVEIVVGTHDGLSTGEMLQVKPGRFRGVRTQERRPSDGHLVSKERGEGRGRARLP